MTMRDFGAELESVGAVRLNDANRRLAAAQARLRAGVDPYEADPSLATEPDPVVWSHKMLFSPDGKRLALWPHQIEDLRLAEKRIVHQDGRETGKTVDIAASVLHYANTTDHGSGLVATPHQSSLDTIIDYIELQLELNPALAKDVKIVRQPYVKITFGRTKSVIHFRQAGPYGDAFRSLHVARIWVDEAAWMPGKAWKAIGRCLLPEGVMRVYSNPNGLRDTEYYRFTQNPTWRVVRWPSTIAPTWNEERRRELADYYNGENTPGWQHEVMGEHGAPSFGAFDSEAVLRALCAIENYTLRRLSGDLLTRSESAAEKTIDENFASELSNISEILDLPPRRGVFYLGADLGYTSDPAEMLLIEESPSGEVSVALRVHCERVPYPQLCMILTALDREYAPVGMGIDAGHNGISVFHDLTQLPQYRPYNFISRLQAYDFGGTIVVGEDEDGHQLKSYAKEHMTKLINEALAKNRLKLPDNDNEITNQLCTQTYVKSDRRIIYTKKDDHVIDALRCAMLRRDRQNDEFGGTSEFASVNKLRPVLTNRAFI